MKNARLALCLLAASVAATAAYAAPEVKPAAKPEAAAAGAPPDFAPPKPGPHHQHLAQDVGNWDATVEEYGAPGTPPTTSKATETVTLAEGGLWIVSTYKGSFMGTPFEGHGLTGYDPATNKYNGYWVDSMITKGMVLEGTCDSTGKKRTMTGQGAGPNGPMTFIMEMDHTGPDSRVFTLSAPGPDGKPMPMVKISYKRRK